MGLVPGFVFSLNKRAILAILAIGVSVSYALVAGAAVSGLKDAQDTIAADLEGTELVATLPDGESFHPRDLPEPASYALATTHTDNRTWYAVRAGTGAVTNDSLARAAPASGLSDGAKLTTRAGELTVQRADALPGASETWLAVSNGTLFRLGGPSAPFAHIAVYTDPTPKLAASLEDEGFIVGEAPATFAFYQDGADQLISAVRVTVLASTLVVGMLTSAFISLELRAKRSSFATLRLYADQGLVQRLVAGRGTALLIAGHLVGIGVTLGAIELVARAGQATLALPLSHAAFALTATLGGGAIGLIPPVRAASRDLEVSDLQQDDPPGNLPAWLRPTLTSWRTLVPLAVAAAILAASLGVIFGAVDMPNQVFGTEGTDANVLATTTGNPLRGTASAFLGQHMGDTDGYVASSPEIFAPTVLEGRAVMARGILWDNLARMDGATLTEGDPPHEPGQAVLGHRLARVLDAEPGDRIHVPASYHAAMVPVEIVGIAKAQGLLADELLVHLDTARELASLPPGVVNLVRYREDPSALPAGLTPSIPSGLQVTGLTIQPDQPLPHEQATATIQLVNFDDQTRSRQLTLRVNALPAADAFTQVGPRGTATVEIPFRVPGTGAFELQVNPSQTVTPGEPAYELDTRRATIVDTELTVRVTDRDQEPAEGVELTLLEEQVTTDAQGEARFVPDEVGNHTLTANGPDGRGARSVLVVERGHLHAPHLIFPSIAGPTQIDPGPWQATAIVENIGGAAFDGMVQIPVNGNLTNTTRTSLLSGERDRISFTLELVEGVHTIGSGESALRVTAGDPDTAGPGDPADPDDPDTDPDPDDGNTTGPDDDPGTGDGEDGDGGGDGGDSDGPTPDGSEEPTIAELLAQRRGGGPASPDTQLDPLQAFLGDTFENFNTAVTLIVIVTVFHSALVVLVAVRRDVEERTKTIGTLAAIGSDRSALRNRAIKEFLLVGTAASILGTALGLALVELAANLTLLSGFGHSLIPRTELGFSLRIVFISTALVIAAAILAVESIRSRRMDELMTEGPARSQAAPLEALLGEAP